MTGRDHLSPLLKQATPITAVRGEGTLLFDADGRRYLDFTSGIGVTSTGHCHPRVVDAARRQVGELIHGQYTTVLHPRLLELSERLAGVMPAAIDTFFYASAGTEAVEAALRLAKQATGRTNVIVFQGGFHGRTTASLAMTTSKAAYRAGLQPLMSGVFVAPFPYGYRYGWDEDTTTAFCLRELDHLLATQTAPAETAAIVIEPVLGEGGYVPVTPGFLEGLRERCDRHGMLLVLDEVQSGFGRTGKFWAHQHHGATPDIVITAKGLASGFPLSAFGAPRALMEQGWPGSQGGTYGGNAVACAAAIATLDVIEEEGLVAHAAAEGARLEAALQQIAGRSGVIGDVRGAGLMIGVELTGEDREPLGAVTASVLREAAANGLLMLGCGPYGNVIRWVPPLTVSPAEIDEALEIFAASLEKATA